MSNLNTEELLRATDITIIHFTHSLYSELTINSHDACHDQIYFVVRLTADIQTLSLQSSVLIDPGNGLPPTGDIPLKSTPEGAILFTCLFLSKKDKNQSNITHSVWWDSYAAECIRWLSHLLADYSLQTGGFSDALCQ